MTQRESHPHRLEFIARELRQVTEKFAQDGLSDVLDEVLDAFLTEAETLRNSYERQIYLTDCESFAKVVHNLKGTFGAIGQRTLRDKMEQLEQIAIAKNIDWSEALNDLEEFLEQFDALQNAVFRIRQGRESAS